MRFPLLLALALACSTAGAQTYRWTDPATGRTVIADTPPPASVRSVSRSAEATPAGQSLSFAAKRAADNFPVTLYTAPECEAPCKDARDLLRRRGVPFTERSVDKPEDARELKQLVGDHTVPALTVGRQSMAGFAAKAYNDLLDLAGYPPAAGDRAKGAKP